MSGRTVYFVRHGETDWNTAARLQGRRDVPLNETGRGQAREVGRLLAGLVPDPASLDYVASPLGRTRETTELLRGALGLAPASYRCDERLAEIAFGEWEGLTWREVRRADAARYAARERDRWAYAPPGGESYAAVALRAEAALADLSRDAVVVSHGGVARALMTLLSRTEPHVALRASIWQGRVLVFEGGAHRWV